MSASLVRRPATVLNLCFHGIGAPRRSLEPDEGQYWVGVDRFEELLAAIRRYPSIHITFDDGNASDLEHALPALLRHNLTATFFVVAGRIDQPGSLSSDGIRRLVSSGMAIGSHGLTHRPWRMVDDRELQAEMNASRLISDVAGLPVEHAACPFGSYDRRVLSALRRHGFTRVYTVDEGHARAGEWLQTRYTITNTDSPESIERLTPPSLSSLARRGRTLVKRLR